MGKIEEYAKRTQILVFAVLGSSGGLAPLPGRYPRIFCTCRFVVRRFLGPEPVPLPPVRQGRKAKIEDRSAAYTVGRGREPMIAHRLTGYSVE